MFSSGPALGWFPMTDCDREVVLALAVDEACQWLLTGDTAGNLHLFNIEKFCTMPNMERQEKVKAKVSWEAHSSEILSVAWTVSGHIISASGDHSVKMWTSKTQYVGCFGQPQFWSPATSPPSPSLTATGIITRSFISVGIFLHDASRTG
jgi:WD40 repeat protein